MMKMMQITNLKEMTPNNAMNFLNNSASHVLPVSFAVVAPVVWCFNLGFVLMSAWMSL